MKPVLEVFFDYACPYCLRSHEYLAELLPRYSNISVEWRPCESHPRPDRYGPHSDLCIRGMFFAADHDVDLWEYHKRVYRAALIDRVDIEDVDCLAGCMKGLLDTAAYKAALHGGQYLEDLRQSNAYAFEESGVWVVPAFRMCGKKLDAAENVGVTKKQLIQFLGGADSH